MKSGEDKADGNESGYILPYGERSADFNFNAMALLAVFFFVLTFILAYPPVLLPAAGAAGVAYYYYPLTERRKPRLGAGQYGVFVDGLGLISWRAIADIDTISFTSRLAQTHELRITLNRPLDDALLADWRKLPLWRMLMKLPWHMPSDEVVCIPLEPFDPPAREIRSQFVQLRDHYR